jgi:hypothetical protein
VTYAACQRYLLNLPVELVLAIFLRFPVRPARRGRDASASQLQRIISESDWRPSVPPAFHTLMSHGVRGSIHGSAGYRGHLTGT